MNKIGADSANPNYQTTTQIETLVPGGLFVSRSTERRESIWVEGSFGGGAKPREGFPRNKTSGNHGTDRIRIDTIGKEIRIPREDLGAPEVRKDADVTIDGCFVSPDCNYWTLFPFLYSVLGKTDQATRIHPLQDATETPPTSDERPTVQ